MDVGGKGLEGYQNVGLACLDLGLLGSVCVFIQAVGYWLPGGNMICSEREKEKDMNEKIWLVYSSVRYDATM